MGSQSYKCCVGFGVVQVLEGSLMVVFRRTRIMVYNGLTVRGCQGSCVPAVVTVMKSVTQDQQKRCPND